MNPVAHEFACVPLACYCVLRCANARHRRSYAATKAARSAFPRTLQDATTSVACTATTNILAIPLQLLQNLPHRMSAPSRISSHHFLRLLTLISPPSSAVQSLPCMPSATLSTTLQCTREP